MIVIYNKGDSQCQICHSCIVGYFRKTLVSQLSQNTAISTTVSKDKQLRKMAKQSNSANELKFS